MISLDVGIKVKNTLPFDSGLSEVARQAGACFLYAFCRPQIYVIILRMENKADLQYSYDQYLITGYSHSTQPKNKGRFSDLLNCDQQILTVINRCRQSCHPSLH